jgi:3-oxoadipate enol-lactonase
MIQQRELTASDGTRIGYQVSGDGPCVVLANGLGGRYMAFTHLYRALEGYKTICWDYRGLYSSGAPADRRANTMAHHVADLVEILAAEQVTDVVLVGWSMGVQLAFETVKRHPERVRGVLAINGTYGHAFHTVMGSRLIGQIIPMLLRLVRAQAGLVGRASKFVAASDALITAMKRVGMVSESVDVAIFREVAAGFKDLDWVIYSDLLQRLDEHDARDVLAQIAVPLTIITGDRDLLTPPSTAELIHRAVRGSRLVVIQRGTHYTPVEYPAIIVDELGRLLDRIPGWGRVPGGGP